MSEETKNSYHPEVEKFISTMYAHLIMLHSEEISEEKDKTNLLLPLAEGQFIGGKQSQLALCLISDRHLMSDPDEVKVFEILNSNIK